MIRRDLVREVADMTGWSLDDAGLAVDAVITSLAEALGEGERVELRGLGVWALKTFAKGRKVCRFNLSRPLKRRLGIVTGAD